MNAALLETLFQIGLNAFAAIQRIRADDPAAYEAVSKHVVDSLEAAKAAALKPD
jgi:tRNA U34 5-methylaminomethyl-2-thiouridine-forming methyltransferase MnmC